MSFPMVLLVIALCSLAAHLSFVSCLRLPRIINGKPADIKDVPYMVSVLTKLDPSNYTACGGSLITPKCVLTAAHCVGQKHQMQIRGGSSRILPQMQTGVEDVFIPEDYNKTYPHNRDVAILRLTKPLKGPNMKTIALDYSEVKEGDNVSVMGWGRTIPNNKTSVSSVLMKTEVSVLSTSSCRKMYKEKNSLLFITEDMFCCFTPYKDSCEGDSGGPAVRNGKQVGIVSFGLECASDPGVYVRIGSLGVSSYIKGIVNKHC